MTKSLVYFCCVCERFSLPFVVYKREKIVPVVYQNQGSSASSKGIRTITFHRWTYSGIDEFVKHCRTYVCEIGTLPDLFSKCFRMGLVVCKSET